MVNAGVLLSIMETRLCLQEKGIANPSESVKKCTKDLVEGLSNIDASEEIIITDDDGKYIRALTGEVLAVVK